MTKLILTTRYEAGVNLGKVKRGDKEEYIFLFPNQQVSIDEAEMTDKIMLLITNGLVEVVGKDESQTETKNVRGRSKSKR